MRIARVFPMKTSMSPIDSDAYFGEPDLFTPQYDEVHISVTFTWDLPKAKRLFEAWQEYGKVKIGGVAINGESRKPFRAGMYLRKGVTITSRGCPKICPFCISNNELIEFDDFSEGNIIQDNNILACSKKHWQLVIAMLKKQHAIEFKGGLDKDFLTSQIVDDLRGLAIKSLWLSCDKPEGLKNLQKAVNLLRKGGFVRRQIFCYVLCGEDMEEEEKRMRKIYEIGAIPFGQLYRDAIKEIKYSKEWRKFIREWSRPAIIKSKFNHLIQEIGQGQ